MRLPDYFTPHTVTIRNAEAGGGMGGGLGEPRDLPAWVEDEQHTVATAASTETLSSATVAVDLDETVPLGSMVTVWKGRPRERTAKVIAVTVFEHERLPSFQTLHLE